MTGYFPPPPRGWTCFHCGETFGVWAQARDHFGATPEYRPLCVTKAERGLAMKLREVEQERDELEVRLKAAMMGVDQDECVERFRASREPSR